MTIIVIGPVTKDLVIIGEEKSSKIGGATYFQSFVFEEFYPDYIAVVNCSDSGVVDDFPDSDKVKVILKDNTHYFINKYPINDDLDVREQLSNFANIPILKKDLEEILPEDIDGFVLNPLNRFDFPLETVEFLKSFDVPVFVSLQGFLRIPFNKINENYTIKLDNFSELNTILNGVSTIFLDEAEEEIVDNQLDVSEIVITDGSNGSRIISRGNEIKIDAVICDNVVDTTGCGDTYMASYISKRLRGYNPKEAGKFASWIASKKIENFGPFNSKL